jgi:uncharacterized membrane protein HdeD (DUF308 family)
MFLFYRGRHAAALRTLIGVVVIIIGAVAHSKLVLLAGVVVCLVGVAGAISRLRQRRDLDDIDGIRR